MAPPSPRLSHLGWRGFARCRPGSLAGAGAQDQVLEFGGLAPAGPTGVDDPAFGAAIAHHDFAARALADESFRARSLPVPVDVLPKERVGPAFVDYLIETFRDVVTRVRSTPCSCVAASTRCRRRRTGDTETCRATVRMVFDRSARTSWYPRDRTAGAAAW